MSYGTYTLEFICLSESCGRTISVDATVRPGEEIIIDAVNFGTPPAYIPSDLSATIDTARLAVTLHWQPAPDSMTITGYAVYRYAESQSDQFSNKPLTILPADNACLFKDSALYNDEKYVYGVASVTASDTGRKSDPVRVEIPLRSVVTIDTVPGTDRVFLNYCWDSYNRLVLISSTPDDGHSTNANWTTAIQFCDDHFTPGAMIPLPSFPISSSIQCYEGTFYVSNSNTLKHIAADGSELSDLSPIPAPFESFFFHLDTLVVRSYDRSKNSFIFTFYTLDGTALSTHDSLQWYQRKTSFDGNCYRAVTTEIDMATFTHDVSFEQYSAENGTTTPLFTVMMSEIDGTDMGWGLIGVEAVSGGIMLYGPDEIRLYSREGQLQLRLKKGSLSNSALLNSGGQIALMSDQTTLIVLTPHGL